MADVRPFRGIRYNRARAGDLSLNVCPPFDVISPSVQQELYQRSPYNAVRLEFGRELPSDRVDDNRYIRAAATLSDWLESGVLVRDDYPAMYLFEESFSHRGRALVRRGLLSAVRLEEFGKGVVLPHEFTRPEPKRDRLELMRATRASFSPLMTLFRDTPDGAFRQLFDSLSSAPPLETAEPPGMPGLRLWRISDPQVLQRISDLLAASHLYLADGHHRYETAISFRDEVRQSRDTGADAAVNFRMMSLIPIDDPGLLLLGYHRTVGGCSSTELEGLRDIVRSAFDLEPGPPGENTAEELEDHLRAAPPGGTVLGIAGLEPGATHVAAMRQAPGADELQSTDYSRLHYEVLGSVLDPEREAQVVSFDHDAGAALRSVWSGDQQLAFIMRAVPLNVFERIVSRGERLPSKSTFFHPKLHTGSVIQSLEGAL
jgi:uncharacterized protein (DUF1015 family)